GHDCAAVPSPPDRRAAPGSSLTAAAALWCRHAAPRDCRGPRHARPTCLFWLVCRPWTWPNSKISTPLADFFHADNNGCAHDRGVMSAWGIEPGSESCWPPSDVLLPE